MKDGPEVLEKLVLCRMMMMILYIHCLTGLRQLEVLASLGLLAIITNYIIFMTLFPASLSMILEVSYSVYELFPVFLRHLLLVVLQHDAH